MSPTSGDILNALRAHHRDDVFVPECKDGPTNGLKGHARLDAWAMRRSWARPCIWGYEIKVSRSDWRNDDKWHNYLPTCNQLWFVAPKGLIDKAELPAEVGLKELRGSRLFVASKAAHRTIEPPVDVYQYIIQSRAVIEHEGRSSTAERKARLDYWRAFVEDREGAKQQIGWRASKSVAQHVEAMEKELASLRGGRLGKVDEWLLANGIELDRWDVAAQLERIRRRTQAEFDEETQACLHQAQRTLALLLKRIGTDES